MERIEVRPVEATDSDILLEWANDPVVRAASLSPDPITREEHQQWFEESFAIDTRRHYVAMINNRLIGQIRFDKVGNGWEIDVSVAPSLRGQGYGTHVIVAGVEQLATDEPQARIARALIRPNNPASLKAFRQAGFVDGGSIERTAHTVLILEKDLFN